MADTVDILIPGKLILEYSAKSSEYDTAVVVDAMFAGRAQSL